METNVLRTQKISRLLFVMALPAIIAQMVTLFYNVVDRIFIGQMAEGTLAMAAIGICAPIVTIISAFTALFGRGGAPLAAIELGAQNKEKAQAYTSVSFLMLIISSLIMIGVVVSFQDLILTSFGAAGGILPYAREYLSIYIWGTVFVQISVGMNYYISTQGFAKTAMFTTALGGVLNIILDPLFIFAFNMGIKGAALATILSQMVSCIWVLCFLFGKKSYLKISLKNHPLRMDVLKPILVLGLSPFFMSVSEGILNICFNTQVLKYGGEICVSAMTILFSVFQFILLPVEGIAQGAQPIISYNYGAKMYHRVKKTIYFSMAICFAFTVCGCLWIEICPEFFIRIFNSSPELLEVGKPMLRVYAFGLFMIGINSTCQQAYNSLGQGKQAFMFAFLRKVILLIPLIYILPFITQAGVLAVMLAEPISDILTTLANFICFKKFSRKLLSNAKTTAE